MTADRGEGEGEEQGRGRRGRVFALEWDTGLPLDREETDAAHRQMDIYKSTGGTPCEDEEFNFSCTC